MPRDPKITPIDDAFEPFPTLDLAAMLALPAPRWLVRDLLPETGLALIFGESNTFKSFVAIDLVCHIAHGLEWCGKKVQQGAVLYLAGEGGHGVARLRIPAWHHHNNLMDTNPPIRLVKIPVNLCDKKAVKRLVATVRKVLEETGCPIRAVVIDTLARSFSGDENSGEAMGAFLAGCATIQADFNCLVLVVHHSGWNARERSRGHSSLWGAIDCRIIATSDPDIRTATIEVERQKDGASGEQFHLQGYVVEIGRDEDGEPLTSLVFKASNAPVETGGTDLRGRPKDLYGILVRFSPEGLTYSEWWDEARKAKIKSKDTFTNARDALVSKGYVRQDGNRFFAVVTA